MSAFERKAVDFQAADAAAKRLRGEGASQADIDLAETVLRYECMRVWMELTRNALAEVGAANLQGVMRTNLLICGYPAPLVEATAYGLCLLLFAEERGETITTERFERTIEAGWLL